MIEHSVQIHRPVAEVYAFYRDFTNLPRFLGDVMAVEATGPGRWRWTIQGPLGIRVGTAVRTTQERPNSLLRYETSAPGMLRGRWEVHFAASARPGSTDLRERIMIPFEPVGRSMLIMIGKSPAAELEANLHRLKQLLEIGVVTDTRHAVPGKFSRPPG
jgi:uncharacterized membrane protein